MPNYLQMHALDNRKRSIEDVTAATPISCFEELNAFSLAGTLEKLQTFVEANKVFANYASHKKRGCGGPPPLCVDFIGNEVFELPFGDVKPLGARTISIFVDGDYEKWEDFYEGLQTGGSIDCGDVSSPNILRIIDSFDKLKLVNCGFTYRGLFTCKIPREHRESQDVLLKTLEAVMDQGELSNYLFQNTIIYKKVHSPIEFWQFEIGAISSSQLGLHGSHCFARLITPGGYQYSCGLWRLDEPSLKQNQRAYLELPDRSEAIIVEGIEGEASSDGRMVEITSGSVDQGTGLSILSKILYCSQNENVVIYSSTENKGYNCCNWIMELMEQGQIDMPREQTTMSVRDYVSRCTNLPLPNRGNWLEDLDLFCANYYFTRSQKLDAVSSPLKHVGVPPLIERPCDLELNHRFNSPHLLAKALFKKTLDQSDGDLERIWKIDTRKIYALKLPR